MPEADIWFSLPEYCDEHDEPTWHIAHYWCYSDGTYSVCDADGNHDPVEEADLPSIEEHDRLWRDYAKWVVEHGEDPLGNYIVKHSRKTTERWRFRFSNSILGPLLTTARHAGRLYDVTELPAHVRSYLNLGTEAHGLKLGDFATWAELVAAQPGIKPGCWWSVPIEHNQPRPAAIVARELRRYAKAQLKR